MPFVDLDVIIEHRKNAKRTNIILVFLVPLDVKKNVSSTFFDVGKRLFAEHKKDGQDPGRLNIW